MKKTHILISAVLLSALFFTACPGPEEDPEYEITGFSFLAANNGGLLSDIDSTISGRLYA